ncbi:MAG: hypothetical protein CL843_01865 [Crocinitomicaceae bacterium]|nr:hypothetical protein [Crocinitomicaceae bacterium]|tara:strand:- start:5624 stop:6055 length:432 start_codon:yes stop_codon:yes gene_type:complete
MANETPLVNGTRHSWASVELNIMGRVVTGVTEISYSDTQTKENIYGAGKYPVARGRGNYEATASITLLSYEVDAIQTAAGEGKRLQDIEPFDIVVTYLKEGQSELVTHYIRDCEFTNNAREMAQGDTSISVSLELTPSHIKWS